MAKAKSLKTQTVYDPMQNIVSTSVGHKKNDFPVFPLDPDVAAKLDRFFELSATIKDLEGEKSACYNDVKDAAFAKLVDTHFSGSPTNIRIQGNKSTALFMCASRGSTYGRSEKEVFEKTWGPEAANTLLEVDTAKVKINTAVWDANKEVLLKALNATDATGKRIVPESVIQNLFAVNLKVKSDVMENAKKFVEDADGLGHLYQDLGLVTSLKG